MGFFKDFKRDFAQAVNELVPDKDGLTGVYDDEDMVNTFDEADDIEIDPEDLLEDLDDIVNDSDNINEDVLINMDSFSNHLYEEEDVSGQEDISEEENIPQAEIIPDNVSGGMTIDDVEDDINTDVNDNMSDDGSDGLTEVETDQGDELKAVDDLDEADMLDNIEDAVMVESEAIEPEPLEQATDEEDVSWGDVDISKAALDAINNELSEKNTDEVISSTENISDMDVVDNMETINHEITNSSASDIISEDITYITKGTTVKGDIETDGGIDIIGNVIGDVTCGNKIILGGTIKGNVSAKELYANAAKIEGEVTIEGNAKIGVGSVIVGNVVASSAVVAGAVNGDIDVHGPVIVDSTAVIMGNIKSRSVQINNGAVIEGFCSQCYSEIDVKSFFE